MDSTQTLFEAVSRGIRLEMHPDGSDRVVARPSSALTDELRQGIRENRVLLRKDLMMRNAHEFLEGEWVEDADLSELDGWHEVIGREYLNADPELFKIAIRAYTRAGLRAFRQARMKRKEVA